MKAMTDVTTAQSRFGVMGLGTMGQSLTRNLARHRIPVAAYNRTLSRTETFFSRYGGEGPITPARTVQDFVAGIHRPRPILLMVQAGSAVDEAIAELLPHLDPGDLILDGGNSLFEDTRRRAAELEARGLRFLGIGVSGGEVGALNGPSLMPGGSEAGYRQVEAILTGMAAQVDGTPCCAFMGPDGAGHFVKMVHNGIEYAIMQLIAEAYDLLRQALGLGADQLAEIFSRWNQGELDSYLIGITAEVLRKRDPSGQPLVSVILDEAEQKGTGKWTVQSALDLGVSIPAIAEAVLARSLSALKSLRVAAAPVLSGPQRSYGGEDRDLRLVDEVREALYASMIVAYAQGFTQLAAGSAEYDWGLKLASVATIWRGGCIIRARVLNRIKAAYEAQPDLQNLLLHPDFRQAMAGAQVAWRRVARTAIDFGVPAPVLGSCLAYYDGLRRGQSPAGLIAGLRDYFGAHGYRRVDREGSFHTRWAQDGVEVQV